MCQVDLEDGATKAGGRFHPKPFQDAQSNFQVYENLLLQMFETFNAKDPRSLYRPRASFHLRQARLGFESKGPTWQICHGEDLGQGPTTWVDLFCC